VSTRGAKPLPTKLKLIRGTLRSDRRNPCEAAVKAALPDCPEELSEAAKDEWQRIAPELLALGLLASIDRSGLALYCEAYARWIDAITSIQKYGAVIKSPSGFPIQSPYVAIANKAGEQVRLMLAEFGMTPAARSRVHAEPQGKEASKWAGLL
jgi:P27 family predicted phage terminase small subunit